MTREEVFKGIIEAADPLDPITEDTVIADCEDLDSLALFNIVMYLKGHGVQVKLEDLVHCVKVSDIVSLAVA